METVAVNPDGIFIADVAEQLKIKTEAVDGAVEGLHELRGWIDTSDSSEGGQKDGLLIPTEEFWEGFKQVLNTARCWKFGDLAVNYVLD